MRKELIFVSCLSLAALPVAAATPAPKPVAASCTEAVGASGLWAFLQGGTDLEEGADTGSGTGKQGMWRLDEDPDPGMGGGTGKGGYWALSSQLDEDPDPGTGGGGGKGGGFWGLEQDGLL